jgi:hypothetical protein
MSLLSAAMTEQDTDFAIGAADAGFRALKAN